MRTALRVLIALALLFTAACGQAPPPDRLTEGGAFPPVLLPHFDGGHTALNDYRGKLVILNIWATWCAPCRAELPSLDRLAARLDPDRFVVIGLSVDSEKDIAREFLRERRIRFSNYIDLDQQISRDILDIRVYPDTFLIGPQGRLLRRIVGERRWDEAPVAALLERALGGDYSALAQL
ncbi:MAG: redoxin domain-containing protein [Gammaproteobacteria bacterium]